MQLKKATLPKGEIYSQAFKVASNTHLLSILNLSAFKIAISIYPAQYNDRQYLWLYKVKSDNGM